MAFKRKHWWNANERVIKHKLSALGPLSKTQYIEKAAWEASSKYAEFVQGIERAIELHRLVHRHDFGDSNELLSWDPSRVSEAIGKETYIDGFHLPGLMQRLIASEFGRGLTIKGLMRTENFRQGETTYLARQRVTYRFEQTEEERRRDDAARYRYDSGESPFSSPPGEREYTRDYHVFGLLLEKD